ncbi:MAG: arylsulfatase [Calditrichaeota bacterium]|nr:arylsulfatase [Calditrichota bacterium]
MKKPNIVLIMADDMGYSDLGCFGSEINTPNIDSLAEEGLKFTQFYNCARCCPTRASLLTGLYPHRAGMGSMINRKNQPRPPAYQGYLNDHCVTIAEVLRQTGYHTLMSGKWHVGEHRPHWPLNRGFERYYGLISGASSYFDTSYVVPGTDKVRIMVNDDKEIVEKGHGFYMTDAIADHAVEMIKNYANSDKPFFLYTAFTAPHWPLHALKEDIEKYRDKYLDGWDVLREKRRERMISLGLIDEKWGLSKRDNRVPPWERAEHKQWEAMRMAVYAAQIDRMDQGIGRILAELKRTGADKNTLIFFLSDNGGCAEILRGNSPEIMPGGPDSYMSYGIGWANASNTPFRRYKKWVHEGGISTPLIARWKGVVKPNTMTQQMGHVIDLMPTILDVAGAKYPEEFKGKKIHKLDGKSLLPALKGKTRQGHEALYWEHLGNCAIRQGKWKLVMDGKLKSWELYDLEDDRTERRNLTEKYPKKVKRMRKQWQKWAEDVKVFPKKLRFKR